MINRENCVNDVIYTIKVALSEYCIAVSLCINAKAVAVAKDAALKSGIVPILLLSDYASHGEAIYCATVEN